MSQVWWHRPVIPVFSWKKLRQEGHCEIQGRLVIHSETPFQPLPTEISVSGISHLSLCCCVDCCISGLSHLFLCCCVDCCRLNPCSCTRSTTEPHPRPRAYSFVHDLSVSLSMWLHSEVITHFYCILFAWTHHDLFLDPSTDGHLDCSILRLGLLVCLFIQ